MKGKWLQDLTWPEAKTWFDRGAVMVVPIGAASKEHGHHLPLCTDLLLAEGITNAVLAELPVLAAPVLTQGYYPAFRHYPGSQTLRPETYSALLHDILRGFIDQGLTRIVVLNTGISTEPVVNICLREIYEDTGVRILGAHISALGRDSEAGLEQEFGGHGDEHETSLILAMAPDRVRMDLARTDYGAVRRMPESLFYVPTIFDETAEDWDFSATGVRGDPTLATVEKGHAILRATARDVIDGIRAHFPDVTGS